MKTELDTRLDSTKVANVLADLKMCLEAVCAKHGLKVSGQKTKWYAQHMDLKLTLLTPNGLTPAAVTYEKYRRTLNLPPLNTEIHIDKADYKIVGMKIGGPHKSICLIKVGTDKPYRFPYKSLKAKLGL